MTDYDKIKGQEQIKKTASERSRNCFFGDSLLFRSVARKQAGLVPELAELGSWAAGQDARIKAYSIHAFPPHFSTTGLFSSVFAKPVNKWNTLPYTDKIDIHPAYHGLLTRARHAGIASSLYENAPANAAVKYWARACRLFLMAQVDCAPLQEMIETSAAYGVFAGREELAAALKPLVTNRIHDPARRSFNNKHSITLGFAIDEAVGEICGAQKLSKELPADFSAIFAEKFFLVTDSIAVYYLNGIKRHILSPLSDGFIVTAQAEGRPGLFFVPFLRAEEQENGIEPQPLRENLESAIPCCDMRFTDSLALRLDTEQKKREGTAENNDQTTAMASLTGQEALNKARDELLTDYAIMAAGLLRGTLRNHLSLLRQNRAILANNHAQGHGLRERILADAALDTAAAEVLALRLAEMEDEKSNVKQAGFAAILRPALIFWFQQIIPKFQDSLARISGQTLLGQTHLACNNRILCPDFYLARDYETRGESLVLLAQLRAAVLGNSDAFVEKLSAFDRLPKAMADGARQVLILAARRIAEDESSILFFVDRLIYSFAAAALYDMECGDIAVAYAESRLGGTRQSDYGSLNLHHNPEFILEALYPDL